MSIYFKYNMEEIRNELNARKASAQKELIAWEAVKIKKKKDGTEFLQLSRALENAKEVYEYGWRRLKVYYRTQARGCESGSIDLYGYIDELPETDERASLPKTSGYIRMQYDFTAMEVREAIEKKKVYLRERLKSLSKQLKEMDALSAKYRETLEKANKELSEATKDGLYNNDLYYLITETR